MDKERYRNNNVIKNNEARCMNSTRSLLMAQIIRMFWKRLVVVTIAILGTFKRCADDDSSENFA